MKYPFVPLNVVAFEVTALLDVAFVVLAFNVATLPVVPKRVPIVAVRALNVLVMSVVNAPIPAVRFVSVVEARVEEPVTITLPAVKVPLTLEVVAFVVDAYKVEIYVVARLVVPVAVRFVTAMLLLVIELANRFVEVLLVVVPLAVLTEVGANDPDVVRLPVIFTLPAKLEFPATSKMLPVVVVALSPIAMTFVTVDG